MKPPQGEGEGGRQARSRSPHGTASPVPLAAWRPCAVRRARRRGAWGGGGLCHQNRHRKCVNEPGQSFGRGHSLPVLKSASRMRPCLALCFSSSPPGTLFVLLAIFGYSNFTWSPNPPHVVQPNRPKGHSRRRARRAPLAYFASKVGGGACEGISVRIHLQEGGGRMRQDTANRGGSNRTEGGWKVTRASSVAAPTGGGVGSGRTPGGSPSPPRSQPDVRMSERAR